MARHSPSNWSNKDCNYTTVLLELAKQTKTIFNWCVKLGAHMVSSFADNWKEAGKEVGNHSIVSTIKSYFLLPLCHLAFSLVNIISLSLSHQNLLVGFLQ